MKYAILRAPHPNVRYDAALDRLAKAEFAVIAKHAGLDASLENADLNGLGLLVFEADATLAQLDAIGRLSSLLALFELNNGALTPVHTSPPILCAKEMASILKYKGKTNESFTRLLINIAVFSSDKVYSEKLKLLDPMCGKGTSLFCALGYGYDSLGMEKDKREVEEGAKFASEYLKSGRYKHSYNRNSLSMQGGMSARSHDFAIQCPFGELKLSLVCADARDAQALLGKRRFSAIVTDLPYGVAHSGTEGKKGGDVLRLVRKALPAWIALLEKGGAVALSFNSHTLKRQALWEAFGEAGLQPMTGEPYCLLEHYVEQAIMRDVAVAVKS